MNTCKEGWGLDSDQQSFDNLEGIPAKSQTQTSCFPNDCWSHTTLWQSWALTAAHEHSLDGIYTRLLCKALSISYRDHVPNVTLYGSLPLISSTLRSRRLQFAGHCFTPFCSSNQLELFDAVDLTPAWVTSKHSCVTPVYICNLYSPKNGRNNNELTNSTNKQQWSNTNYDTNSKCQWVHNLYKFATYFAQQIIRSVIFTNKFINSFA